MLKLNICQRFYWKKQWHILQTGFNFEKKTTPFQCSCHGEILHMQVAAPAQVKMDIVRLVLSFSISGLVAHHWKHGSHKYQSFNIYNIASLYNIYYMHVIYENHDLIQYMSAHVLSEISLHACMHNSTTFCQGITLTFWMGSLEICYLRQNLNSYIFIINCVIHMWICFYHSIIDWCIPESSGHRNPIRVDSK